MVRSSHSGFSTYSGNADDMSIITDKVIGKLCEEGKL